MLLLPSPPGCQGGTLRVTTGDRKWQWKAELLALVENEDEQTNAMTTGVRDTAEHRQQAWSLLREVGSRLCIWGPGLIPSTAWPSKQSRDVACPENQRK